MTQGAGPSSLHLVKETLCGVFTSVNVRTRIRRRASSRELREAVEAAGLRGGGRRGSVSLPRADRGRQNSNLERASFCTNRKEPERHASVSNAAGCHTCPNSKDAVRHYTGRSGCQNAVTTALPFIGCIRDPESGTTDKTVPTRAEATGRDSCFVPLLKWLLKLWKSDRLVLAIDPTMQGDRMTSIVISAVYRSCAIPLAWSIMPANTPGKWMAIVDMLRVLRVPEMTVLVMQIGAEESETVGSDTLCGMASVHAAVDQHRVREGGTRRLRGLSYPDQATRILGQGRLQQTEHTPSRMIVVWDRSQRRGWL